MVQNPDEIRRAIHSLLNDVVEQSFQFMLEHPEYEAEAASIVNDASESIRHLVAQIRTVPPPGPNAPRLLHAEYAQRLRRIAETAQAEAMLYHKMLAGLRTVAPTN
jgi:hypothetical protein